MKKSIYVAFFGLCLFSSCITQKENRYILKGTDYGSKPPIWTIGCQYDSFNYNVIDSIIGQLGKDYMYQKTDFDESYEWKNVIVKSISNQRIDIYLNRRLEEVNFRDNEIHHLEQISLKIFKNGKDFLKPLKFRNRIKAQKFLNNIN